MLLLFDSVVLFLKKAKEQDVLPLLAITISMVCELQVLSSAKR